MFRVTTERKRRRRSGRLASAVRALLPLCPRSDRRERSREGIQRPHSSQTRSPPRLLPIRSNWVVRCSPRLRPCSNATTSVQRRLWPSVESVGVGHSEPPVKGSRLRSLDPLCPHRVQGPTQKQEAPTATTEGRVGPSAVGRGSSHRQCRFVDPLSPPVQRVEPVAAAQFQPPEQSLGPVEFTCLHRVNVGVVEVPAGEP